MLQLDAKLERVFERSDAAASEVDVSPTQVVAGDHASQMLDREGDSECEEGDLNPHGCYPTSPSN
jgi:hypothetical protein